MEPDTTGHEAIDHDEPFVHSWRVSQLKRLGIPGPMAETILPVFRIWSAQLILPATVRAQMEQAKG